MQTAPHLLDLAIVESLDIPVQTIRSECEICARSSLILTKGGPNPLLPAITNPVPPHQLNKDSYCSNH